MTDSGPSRQEKPVLDNRLAVAQETLQSRRLAQDRGYYAQTQGSLRVKRRHLPMRLGPG